MGALWGPMGGRGCCEATAPHKGGEEKITIEIIKFSINKV